MTANLIKIDVAVKDSMNAGAIGKRAGKEIADRVGKGADQAAKSVDSAAKKIKADVDRAGSSAKNAGKDIATGIDSGADKAAKSVDSASKKIKKDLDTAGEAGKKAGSELGSGLTEGLSAITSRGGGVGGSLVGGLVDSVKSGKAGMLGAGLLLGGLVMDGIESAVEEHKVGALIAAQTGQAESAAGKLGDTAGNVFYDNFGESIEQVGEAMTAVFQNHVVDTSASQDEIERVTEKVITLGQTTGEEFNHISRSAETAFRTGLAKSATDAFDLIQRAQEKGLNNSGELLDTIDEYGTTFRKVGLNGQEAFGLLDQAVQGGARNIDIAADAVKEFGIRGQDMSATTLRGFKTIGLDANEMGRKIAAGGDSAKDALRQTLNALQQMPPSIERNQAAVDLFGTKAEDLGDALFDMDLDNAAQQFGDYAGSVEKAAQKIGDSATGWDRMGKNIGAASTNLGEWLTSLGDFDPDTKIGQATQKANEFQAAISQFKDSGSTEFLDQLKEKYPELGGAIDEYIAKNSDQAASEQDTAAATDEHTQSITELIAAQQEAAGTVLSEREAMRDYRSAVQDATEAIDKHRKVSDKEDEALDNVAKTALDQASAMDKNGRSVDEVNKVVNNARNRFIQLAQKMGYSKDEAINLANSLKLIPRKVDASVILHAQAAAVNLANLQRALNNLHDKTITVSTYVRGANVNGSGGHQFLSQARGGISTTIGHAAEGGAKSGSTLINEAGPEAVNLPNGSTVMTAGATRAMAERGLLQVDGILETAATGGARGKAAVPSYMRTGQVNIAAGQHSYQFIQNLLNQGWRVMDGNYNKLIAPWLQRRAGPKRHFTTGDLATGGHGDGFLEAPSAARALTGRHGTPDRTNADVQVMIHGHGDSAIAAMINKLHRDGAISFAVRS